MVFALQTVLTHSMSMSVLVAVFTALAVVGIVAGAPSGGADGDAGEAAGGDAAQGDSADTSQSGTEDQDGDAAPGDRRAAGNDDDDEDDTDRDLPEEIRNDPKRLRTHLRRTQRQFGKVRPIAERFRNPTTGQYMQPQEIDRVLGRAQDMAELETFFADHPDVVQTILEKRRGGKGAVAAAEDTFQDPFANPADLPWDTETPEGKKFLELFRDGARHTHELRQHIKRLEGQLGQVNQRDTTRTLAGIENTWKSATLAAAARVPDHLRESFVTNVWRAYELAKHTKALGRVQVQQVLERELKPYLRAARGAQRQTVAGAQRSAEHNNNIPRPGTRSNGAANPKDSNKAGTIKDARKSFFDRVGMNPTTR